MPDAYERGLSYDDVIAGANQQELLGWQVQLSLTAEVNIHQLVVTFRDRDGSPLSGLTVTGRIVRPTNEGQDRALRLKETTAGRYEAALQGLPAGQWDIRVMGALDEQSYRLTKRVIL